jgi:hypothetical protein
VERKIIDWEYGVNGLILAWMYWSKNHDPTQRWLTHFTKEKENHFCHPMVSEVHPTKWSKCLCLWLVPQTPPKTAYNYNICELSHRRYFLKLLIFHTSWLKSRKNILNIL